MPFRDFRGDRRNLKLPAYRPGHLFMMPRGATWLNQDKPRPYALATPCDPARRGTLVYGSSRPTERIAAAANFEVAPQSLGVNANGLLARTYFYPGILVPTEYDLLPAHTGSVAPMLDELRRTLRTALGIGSGTCRSPTAPAGSWRGRIVLLAPVFATAFDTRHAVVLTEHGYSRTRRYQVIVPILPGESIHASPEVVRVPRQGWFEIFPQPNSSALLLTPLIQSVWHPEDVVAETHFVLDPASLDALERRLCMLFQID